MAHLINFKNGKASMFYVNEVPWHKLGTKFSTLLTSTDAIKAAQMDYEVVKIPTFAEWEGKRVDVPRFATIRTDTGDVLGSVGRIYTPLQNRDAFKMFDDIVGEGIPIFETGGVLGSGERIWLLAKLPGYIKIKTRQGTMEDVIEKYLLFTNAHDGSKPILSKFTGVRVVCNNTLQLAINEDSDKLFRIRHTGQAKNQLNQAKDFFGLVNTLSSDLEGILNLMADIKVNDKQGRRFIYRLLPNQKTEDTTRLTNIRDTILDLSFHGAGSKFSKETLWGMVNGVTEYVDHIGSEKNYDAEKHLNRMWFGSGADLKDKAFNLAVQVLDRKIDLDETFPPKHTN